MKQEKNQNENETEKKVWINFQATESFKKKLKKYAEDILKIKQSAFIRQAIREKIINIDNPDRFGSVNLDYGKIETIIEKKLGDKQIEEKLDILIKQREDFSKTLRELRRTIFEFTTIQESQIKTNIIVDYIKKGPKSVKEIMDYTGYDKMTVLSLIHNLEENEIARYNVINGRVEYIE